MKKILIILMLAVFICSMLFVGVGCKEEAAADEEAVEEMTETVEEETVEEEAVEEEIVEEESGRLPVTTEEITINMWVLAGPAANWFAILTDKYMEEHPNVKFNITIQEKQALEDFTPSALASGEEDIDFLWFWASSIGHDMAKNGLLTELSPYFEAYGWWDQMYSNIKGDTETEGLGNFFFVEDFVIFPFAYYNKAIFDEVGVEPPATMDDIFTMSEKIKAAGYEVWATGNKNLWTADHVLDTILVRFLSEEEFTMLTNISEGNNIEIFKNQNYIDALAYLQKMATDGVFIDSIGSIDDGAARLLFTSGKAAIYSTGSWGVGLIRDEAPDMDFGFFSLPEHIGTNRILTFFQNSVCIPSTTTDQDKLGVILDFMDSILKKEYALTSFQAGIISSSLNITEEDIAAVADPVLAAQIAETQEKGGVMDYGSKWDSVLFQARYDSCGELVVGTMTPEEAAEYMYNTAVEVLAE